MKTCRKCLESKDHSEFHRSSANKDGLQSYCKRCLSRYVTERRISQPLAKTDAQREKNRIYARLYRYGLSKEKFESMLEEQGNACAVCSTEFSDEVKPHVDHDHKCCVGNKTCGKCVRGLL